MARGALAENLNALAALVEKGVVGRAEAGVAARERTVPVLAVLAGLLPAGALQRGSVVACQGAAGVSLALSLAAGPSQEGAWVGVAGLPGLVAAAAVEAGVAPERLVLVNERGRAPGERFGDPTWGDVVAAMIDGFDVVLLGPVATEALRPATARRLASRLQARGGVLLLAAANSARGSGMGGRGASGVAAAGTAAGFVADLTITADSGQWFGLADGHGVARGRRTTVHAAGRRMPRSRSIELWLPGVEGGAAAIDAIATIERDTGQRNDRDEHSVDIDIDIDSGTVVPLRPTG